MFNHNQGNMTQGKLRVQHQQNYYLFPTMSNTDVWKLIESCLSHPIMTHMPSGRNPDKGDISNDGIPYIFEVTPGKLLLVGWVQKTRAFFL